MTYTAQELLDAIGFEYGQHHVHPDALEHAAVNIAYLERTFDWYMSLSERAAITSKINYWDKQAIRTKRRLLLWQSVAEYQAAQVLRADLAEFFAQLEEDQRIAALRGVDWLDSLQADIQYDSWHTPLSVKDF